ncbi:hypothetical protein [Leifsonia sp. NPDC058230]|uniref:PH-like domain-containing protein n=1 Tax=Leifsonia sp. NPDC058230 TaxID=3346391 RepID=UPI0036DE29F5
MDKFLPAIPVIAVLAIVLLLMLWGWRRRTRRDSSAGGGYAAPATASSPLVESDTFYVATTRGGEHLERLAIPGLKFRGKARLTVALEGVTIAINGENPLFIQADALTGVGVTNTAIDRVVEKDGLLRLSWTTSAGAPADSFFRVVDPADRTPLIGAVETILPAQSTAGQTTESEV